MVSIAEVNLISVDKSDNPWDIEGEIFFESELSTPFCASYYDDDGEFEYLEIEIDPGRYDRRLLMEMIVSAAEEFED